MKIKFGSYDYLPLKQTLEIPSLIIVAAGIFQENNKYYPQIFSDESLCELPKYCVNGGSNKNESIKLMQNTDLTKKRGTL